MPAINIQIKLFTRAIENKVDIAAVVNKNLEEYLDEKFPKPNVDEIENVEG